MAKSSSRLSVLSAALVGVSLLSSGCFDWGWGSSSFLEAEDVRLDVPGSGDMNRAAALDESMVRGHVQVLAVATANDVNAWVTSMVEGSALVVSYLERQPATKNEGSVRIYGPYDDDEGRDMSWLVRLDGNVTDSSFELWVGPRGAKSQEDMEQLLTGALNVDDNIRSGGFTLDFDVVEKYPEMKTYEGALYSYSGKVDVTFERDTESEKKHIDIDFDEYEVLYTGFLDDDVFSTDKTYVYHREADGAGEFHLAVMGEWDEWNWSGPEQEEMVLDMVWTPEGEGRTRGQILESEDSGDLKYGDVHVAECFGEDGYLTWREINEEYLVEDPDYNFGDEATCAFAADVFDG